MNPDILRTLSYGMFAIGVQGEQRPTACIVNTVIQVTAEPMVVAVSVNHDNYTNECIKRTGEFAVSVLSENTSGTVIGALGFSSGRNADKLANVNYKVLREGEPVLREDICCWFLCKVLDSIETLTHTVFLAEVTAGSDEYKGTPMTTTITIRLSRAKPRRTRRPTVRKKHRRTQARRNAISAPSAATCTTTRSIRLRSFPTTGYAQSAARRRTCLKLRAKTIVFSGGRLRNE